MIENTTSYQPSEHQEEQLSTHDHQSPNTSSPKPPFLIVGAIIFILVAFLGIFTYQKYQAKTQPSKFATPTLVKQKQTMVKPTPKKLARRSLSPGLVLGATTAKGFNSKNGQAISPTKTFMQKDNKIVLLMNMKNPPRGTRIEYVRYLNGKYLDHNGLKVTQPGWLYSYFTWVTKPNKSHPLGNYKVRVYSNGILEKNFTYLVKK